MRKIVVIANPASARGYSAKRRAELHRSIDNAIAVARLQGLKVAFQIVDTTGPSEIANGKPDQPGSGVYLAKKAVREGADIVAAAGGDGTIREVVNGLVGTKAILGVLPMGTGNDFSRTLGIGTDLDRAIQTLIFGSPQLIDLGQSLRGYFINVAGCGFDAVVAQRINHGFKYLRGTAVYVAAVGQTLISYRPKPITLEIDGVTHKEIITLCAIANAQSYGGGMRIAPNADLTDGQFDVVLVGNVSKLEFIATFPRVFKGTHIHHPKVKILRGTEVRILSETPMPILADGEEIGFTPIEFKVVPKAIRVMMPALA
jgi:diacylglycerol kinase (ATP)